jgi:hypothetical protein
MEEIRCRAESDCLVKVCVRAIEFPFSIAFYATLTKIRFCIPRIAHDARRQQLQLRFEQTHAFAFHH